ncbi:O-antigen ligase family protein [Halomonas ventosae]|uniref:O-antigen ligase-like membrane protein n=1 Tax=Halomonas ventosae TaxID=229007 RepID=A0A2T0VB15_9GAMM|nr:hypothetical protein [Halomonas ventosae]PRY67389.1 hypothetical protein BCL64_12129 [Halomonas ventosae]
MGLHELIGRFGTVSSNQEEAVHIGSMRNALGGWVLAIQIFFVGMLTLPTTFQLQRGVFLAVLVVLAVSFAIRHWRVHRDVLFLWTATMFVGAFGVVWGVLNGSPGALRVSTVYLVWPAVYFLFIGLAHRLFVIHRLETALLVGVVLATIMALIVLMAGVFGFGELVFSLMRFQDAGFGSYSGSIEFRLYNLTTVMYGFPFVIAVLLARRGDWSGWRTVALWLLLGTILVVSVGSGRRMFWLLVLLSPFVVLFFLQLSALRLPALPLMRVGMRFLLVMILILGMSILALGLDPVAVADQFVAAFLGQENSSSIRFEQASALWGAFAESPLLGNGLGSAVEINRSKEMPWAYELWYLSLLMNVGLLGFLVYTSAVVWVLIKGVMIARKDRAFAALFVPLASAMVIFLIMTATNPYMGKFDYLWVIFLPVALINAYLTKREVDA